MLSNCHDEHLLLTIEEAGALLETCVLLADNASCTCSFLTIYLVRLISDLIKLVKFSSLLNLDIALDKGLSSLAGVI